MPKRNASATSQRPKRLADRLAAARFKRFIGRVEEVNLFKQALNEDEPNFAVLHVYGPGGVGKTTLLREFARMAEESGWVVALLDGRNIDPTPSGFMNALGSALGVADDSSALEALTQALRVTLMVDTYETITPLDTWLREIFLPQLPAHSLVVLGGRNPPADAWRKDSDWSALVRVLSLRNLRPDESRTLLTERGVPQAHHDKLLEFTHGHPLALSLVADVMAQTDASLVFTPERTPDVVDALLKQFVRDVPDARHRTALHICAHTRLTTESLLREAIGDDDVRDVFDWLRGQSFIEQGPAGLFPHDLARDVLESDFRWRDPDGYVALHRAVRAHIVRKMMESSGREQQRWMFDLMYLHRSNPIMKPYWQFKELGTLYVDRAKREDYEDVLDLTARYSGEANARIMQWWLERQPEAFFVVRGRDSLPLAFLTFISLTTADTEDMAADPAIQPMMDYMQRHAPLRFADEVTLCRFVASREDYLQSSPVANAIQMATALHWMTTPHLAWSFVAFPEPEHWQTLMTYVHYHRAYETDFVIGNVPVGVYVHDWRAMSVPQWLDVMGGREIATDMKLEDIEAAPPAPLLVLSQPEFEEAVKRALRDFAKPKLLASNPLLRSRLTVEQAGSGTPTPATLQSLLHEASRSLQAKPKDEKFYRAIHRTYLSPAPTHEAAAEALGVPFNTYRYQLATGLRRIMEWLWEREVSG